MEPKIIQLVKKVHGTIQETKTLYDISETEMIYFTTIIMESANLGLSPKLLARLLKAASHFVETSDEIVSEAVKEL